MTTTEPDTGPSALASPWWRNRPFQVLKWVLAVGVGVLIVRHLYGQGPVRTFFHDEWAFVAHRNSFSAQALLQPHNGHFSAAPAFAYLVMFKTVGLDHYGAFRLIGFAVHVGLCATAGHLVAKRSNWLIGCSTAFALALMGAGWQNTFWPFQIGFMGSIVFTMAAVAILHNGATRSSPTFPLIASALAVLAVASSGVGIAGLGALIVVCVLPATRRRTWWVPLPATVIYAWWYLAYGSSQAKLSNLPTVPAYVGRSGQGALSGLFMVGATAGWVLLGLVVLSVLWAGFRRRIDAVSLAWIVFLVGFWSLTALSRAEYAEPAASRYVYVGAVLLVLIVAHHAPPFPHRRSRRVVASSVVVVVALLTVQRSHDLLLAGADGLQSEGRRIGIELAVVEAIGAQLDPEMAIDPIHAPPLRVGDYLAAIADIGSSPALPLETVMTLSPPEADGVDRLLEPLFGIAADHATTTNCGEQGEPRTEVRVAVDQTVRVSSSVSQSIVIARFADPGASKTEPRSASAGTLTLTAPQDPFEHDWVISFSAPVRLVVCH